MNSVIHASSILQIIPRLDTGGAELATVEITEAIVRAGGRAFVLCEGGRMTDEILKAGGVFEPFPAGTKNPLKMAANVFALARFIRERGVDLVHARSRAPAWSALAACRITDTPFVTTYHGAYGNKGPLKPFYNSAMARGRLVIANSKFTGRLIADRHGVPEERIRVIERGVDLEEFNPQTVQPERLHAIRGAWGIGEGQRIILQAARLTGWKGQRDVIEAAARLYKADPASNAVFVLAGDHQGRDSYVSELKDQITGRGLEKKVLLVGHCVDMAAAYGAAHLTLIASTEPEAFGRTSAEAQAMGCPVIVTRQGASPETVLTASRDGDENATGWIVPIGSPGRMANAIAEGLSLSDRERRAMALRAQAHARETFSSERMKRLTLSVYDECLRTALVAAFDSSRAGKS